MRKKVFFIILAVMVIAVVGVAVFVGNYTDKRPVVCIDAGHGGDDVGATAYDRQEKDDNLKIAKLVKKELEQKNIRVIMTRDSDETISLEERCSIANQKNADLFVALHRNSADSGNGVEIWIKNDAPQADNTLATNILSQLEDVGISRSRGVRTGIESNPDGNYYVNKYTEMPSCLVEMGFISNSSDNKLFDDNLAKYAKGIAQGIYDSLPQKEESTNE